MFWWEEGQCLPCFPRDPGQPRDWGTLGHLRDPGQLLPRAKCPSLAVPAVSQHLKATAGSAISAGAVLALATAVRVPVTLAVPKDGQGPPGAPEPRQGPLGMWHLATATLLPAGRNCQQGHSRIQVLCCHGDPRAPFPHPLTSPIQGPRGSRCRPPSRRHNYGSSVPPTCGWRGCWEQLGQWAGGAAAEGWLSKCPGRAPEMQCSTELVPGMARAGSGHLRQDPAQPLRDGRVPGNPASPRKLLPGRGSAAPAQ